MSDQSKSVNNELAGAALRIAAAIAPLNVPPGVDANGGGVASLTEAIIGITFSMEKIASAIQAVADAIDNSNGAH